MLTTKRYSFTLIILFLNNLVIRRRVAIEQEKVAQVIKTFIQSMCRVVVKYITILSIALKLTRWMNGTWIFVNPIRIGI